MKINQSVLSMLVHQHYNTTHYVCKNQVHCIKIWATYQRPTRLTFGIDTNNHNEVENGKLKHFSFLGHFHVGMFSKNYVSHFRLRWSANITSSFYKNVQPFNMGQVMFYFLSFIVIPLNMQWSLCVVTKSYTNHFMSHPSRWIRPAFMG